MSAESDGRKVVRGPAIERTRPQETHPVVIKSHDLVDAFFPDMTLKEFQIFLLAVSLIRPESPLDKPIRVTFPRQYLEMVFGASNYTSRDLLRIAESLVNRSIQIRSANDEDWEIVNIMASAKYKSGVFSMVFNLALNEHLLSMRPMTKYRLALVAELSSFYHIRLYEILLKGLDEGEVFMDVDVLRRRCGLVGRYEEYRTLKRCVLDPAVKALSKNTDILTGFEELRSGRAVTALRFWVKSKRDVVMVKDAEESEDRRMMRQALEKVGFGPELIDLTLGSYQGTREQFMSCMEAAKAYIERGAQRGEMREPIAVYRAAIRDGWSMDRMPRMRAPKAKGSHPSHATFKELSVNDLRDKAIDGVLLRVLDSQELQRQLKEHLAKRNLAEVVEKLTLKVSGKTLSPVREAIFEFGKKQSLI